MSLPFFQTFAKMKKLLFCAAIAAMAMTACSKADKAAADTAVAENQVAKAERVAADESAEVQANISGDEHKNFTVLKDDSKYRPDMKVERLTILDFNATWCGPCRQFAPVFDQAAEMFPTVDFVSVDTDLNPETAAAFGVNGIPHVAVIKTDGKIDNYVGTGELMPVDKFAKIITDALESK